MTETERDEYVLCPKCQASVHEEDLYWEFPDWPFSCDLVCAECVEYGDDAE